MARTERKTIWADRDSSNDARSSDSEVEVEKSKSKSKKKLSLAVAGKAELAKRGVAGPTKAKAKGKEGKKMPVKEIPSSDAESDEEDDAPPSSQPRPDSEPEDEIKSEDSASEAEDEGRYVRQSIEVPVIAKPRIVIEISSDEEEESDEEAADEDNNKEDHDTADVDDQAEEDEAESHDITLTSSSRPKKETPAVAVHISQGNRKGRRRSDLQNSSPTVHFPTTAGKHLRASTDSSSVGGGSIGGMKKNKDGTKLRHRSMKQSKESNQVSASEDRLQPSTEQESAMSVDTKSADRVNLATRVQRKKERKARLNAARQPGPDKVDNIPVATRSDDLEPLFAKTRRKAEKTIRPEAARQGNSEQDVMSVEMKSFDRESLLAKRQRKKETKARRKAEAEKKRLALQATEVEAQKYARLSKRGTSTVLADSRSSSHKASPVLPVPAKKRGESTVSADSKSSSQKSSKVLPAPAQGYTTAAPQPKNWKSSSHYKDKEKTTPAKGKLTTAPEPMLDTASSYYIDEEQPALLPKTNSIEHLNLSAEDHAEIIAWLKEKRKKKDEGHAKKKAKKMARLGPKKSAYFEDLPTIQDQVNANFIPFSTIRADEIASNRVEEYDGRVNMRATKKRLAKAVENGKSNETHPDKIDEMAREARLAVRLVREATMAAEMANGTPEKKDKKEKRNRKKNRNKNRLSEGPIGSTGVSEVVVVREDKTNSVQPKKVSGQEPAPKPASEAVGGYRKTARGDRGRKRKSTEAGLGVSEAAEIVVSQPAFRIHELLFPSVEPTDVSSKKKRKRSKSTANEEEEDTVEVGKPAADKPLVELADTNAKKQKKKQRRSEGAGNVDGMQINVRPSKKSSKAHHSQ